MLRLLRTNNLNIIIAISIWVMFSFAYIQSINLRILSEQWEFIIYGAQVIFDCLIGWYGFLSYKKNQITRDKNFYFLLLMSIIPGLLTNEIYNIVIHLFKITLNVNQSVTYWSFSYLIFLTLHMVAWGYLYHQQTQLHHKIYFKYILSILITFASCLFFTDYLFISNHQLLLVNSTLELTTFILLILNLSRTKSPSLILVEIGFLILIASNLAHRFSNYSGQYFKIYEVFWFLTLIIITFGLKATSNPENKTISFYPKKSIHTHICQILLLITFLLVFVFIFAYTGFGLLNTSKNFFAEKNFLSYLPSAVLLTMTVAVMCAKKTANYLTNPVEHMLDNVLAIRDHKNLPRDNDHSFYEIQETETIMVKVISELQRANQVKSEFLMNMSHDFRTPTSGIRHLSRLIYERIDDLELKNTQKLVVDSANQLMQLIEAILDYMKLENATNESMPVYFNLQDTINELIAFYQPKIHAKGLALNFEIANNTQKCFSDKRWVYRILVNLLSNAIKYTHQGNITIIVKTSLEWLNISISDTGIGIPKDKHDFIFEPFFRATSADLAEYPGLGLGLSTASLLAKKLNGKISFESKENIGSTFILHLPLQIDE